MEGESCLTFVADVCLDADSNKRFAITDLFRKDQHFSRAAVTDDETHNPKLPEPGRTDGLGTGAVETARYLRSMRKL